MQLEWRCVAEATPSVHDGAMHRSRRRVNFEVQQSMFKEHLVWSLVIETFAWSGVEFGCDDVAVMLSEVA